MQVTPDILNSFDEKIMMAQLKREMTNVASETSKGSSDIEFTSQDLNSNSIKIEDFIN